MQTTAEKKAKVRYTLEQKKALYVKWKKSGLSKVLFCKQNNLADSTFFSWCATLFPKQENKATWLPVNLEPALKETTIVCVELFTRGIQIKLHLPSQEVFAFIQELTHAANTLSS